MSKFIIISIIIISFLIWFFNFLKKRKKRLKKEKLYKEAAEVLNILKRDWNYSYPFVRSGHVSTYREKGYLIYKYITIKGENIYMIDYDIIAKLKNRTIHFKMDEPLKNAFKKFANETIDYVNYVNKHKSTYNTNKTDNNQNKNSKNGNQNQAGEKGNTTKPKNPNENHPKWNTYQVLISTAKSRREQLDKLSKNSNSRSTLQNELIAVEGRIKIFKEKYKF